MIRWLKAQFNAVLALLRSRMAKAQDLLETIAESPDGPQFLALMETNGTAVEAQMVELEKLTIAGVDKFLKLADWVRENKPELVQYVGYLRMWVSAAVLFRKALGLFK